MFVYIYLYVYVHRHDVYTEIMCINNIDIPPASFYTHTYHALHNHLFLFSIEQRILFDIEQRNFEQRNFVGSSFISRARLLPLFVWNHSSFVTRTYSQASFLSLALSLSLSRSLSLAQSLSLSRSIALSLYLSLFLLLSISFYFSLSLFLSLSL